MPVLIIAVSFGSAIIDGLFGFLNGIASGMGVVLGGLIGLASLPGSWVASRLVRRLGARMHIAIIEALIIIGGVSILYHGIRAG